MYFSLMLALLPASLAFPQMVAMSNAADAGMQYPVMGLGTAGGSTDNGFGVYPECWASCVDGECQQPDANGGCGQYTIAAIETWFQLGGRRIDSANGYRNQNAVGRAIRESSVPRSDIFFQTKIGPYLAMGYNESLEQAAVILNVTGLTYIDNLVSRRLLPSENLCTFYVIFVVMECFICRCCIGHRVKQVVAAAHRRTPHATSTRRLTMMLHAV
jgi:diketogulonate reductase-like aldo/keto reductase